VTLDEQAAALDDAVDAWHAAPAESAAAAMTLPEYLGMTWPEYDAWVRDPLAVPARWVPPDAALAVSPPAGTGPGGSPSAPPSASPPPGPGG
jgi:hypothetical protein